VCVVCVDVSVTDINLYFDYTYSEVQDSIM
jgi:hypothetical protein